MALSPSETSKLLRQLEHRPNKKLGQNFLIDGNLVEKSISMASLPTNYPVLEIGPGLGTLTSHLLNLGHKVYAVEIDRRLEAHLRERLNSFIESGQFNLVRADAVKQPIGNLPVDVTEYAVVANLPYAISSAWVEGLLGSGKLPTSMVMMLQKKPPNGCSPPPGLKLTMLLPSFYRLLIDKQDSILYPGSVFILPPLWHPHFSKWKRIRNLTYLQKRLGY